MYFPDHCLASGVGECLPKKKKKENKKLSANLSLLFLPSFCTLFLLSRPTGLLQVGATPLVRSVTRFLIFGLAGGWVIIILIPE